MELFMAIPVGILISYWGYKDAKEVIDRNDKVKW